ncbi:hypothetical protein GCM10023238_06550 [Streptomyces heliomycini]
MTDNLLTDNPALYEGPFPRPAAGRTLGGGLPAPARGGEAGAGHGLRHRRDAAWQHDAAAR